LRIMAADNAMTLEVSGKRCSVFTYVGDEGKLRKMLGDQILKEGPPTWRPDGIRYKMLVIGGGGVGTRNLTLQMDVTGLQQLDEMFRQRSAMTMQLAMTLQGLRQDDAAVSALLREIPPLCHDDEFDSIERRLRQDRKEYHNRRDQKRMARDAMRRTKKR
jgi:hypothetical protein